MPIIRSGYAPQRRNGSTRAYRKARAHILATAQVCELCGEGPRPADPFETDHITPWYSGGSHHPGNLRPAHRSCNLQRSNHKDLPC